MGCARGPVAERPLFSFSLLPCVISSAIQPHNTTSFASRYPFNWLCGEAWN